MDEQKYPPVTQIGMASLALITAGGIYLSANLPEHVSLGPAIVLLALSAALMAFNLLSLTRVIENTLNAISAAESASRITAGASETCSGRFAER